jgi:cytosine/adenosine deaminase-related metal-dependent hydrolase
LGARAGIAQGQAADFVSLDLENAPYLEGDHLLDGWIFGNLVKPDRVWVNGKTVVQQGRHAQREAISRRFRQAMKELLSA